MPSKIYDVDELRARRRKTWEDLTEERLVLIDKLTLIDEAQNFDLHPFQVRDNLRYQTHYPGEVEFRLLGFFDEPRTRADVEAFFATGLPGRVGDPASIDEPLETYMNRILGLGLLKPAPAPGTPSWPEKDGPVRFVAPHVQKHEKTVRSFPTSVAINLTERCNLACLHCCVGSNPTVSTKNDLSAAELSRVFTELEGGGVQTVRLTGGEATVHPEFWEIFEDAASRRFSLVLFTNGTRMREEDVRRLQAVRQAKGSRFSVHLSLDGGTAETHDFLRNRKGNFRRVLKTMELFQQHGVHFFVESVLHAKSFTAEEVDRVAGIVHRYGATWVSFHPADRVGTAGDEQAVHTLTREDKIRLRQAIQPVIAKWKPRGLEVVFNSYNYPLSEPARKVKGDASTKLPVRAPRAESNGGAPPSVEFRRELQQSRSSGHHVCTAGISQMALGADGRVYGCPRYVGDDDNAMGSVRDESLIDIWSSSKWDWLREDYGPKLSLCQHCDYQTNCFYGKTCRANAGRAFRDRYGVGPECIQEYEMLGLPHDVVVAYLHERMEAHPDDAALKVLCESLLAEVDAKERARSGAGETPTPTTSPVGSDAGTR